MVFSITLGCCFLAMVVGIMAARFLKKPRGWLQLFGGLLLLLLAWWLIATARQQLPDALSSTLWFFGPTVFTYFLGYWLGNAWVGAKD